MKKRVLSIVLALCLVFSLLPVSALADTTASGKCGDNLTWTLKNGTLTISGTGAMANYGSSSDAPWSENTESITKIVIIDNVTSIGYSAFSGCSSLTSITIPDSVTSIGEWAFCDCSSLESVTIGNGVTSIGEFAFFGCSSLTAIEVGKDNETYCSDNGVLFNKDKTKLITYPAAREAGEYKIPDGVTSIGDSAFYDCSSLESVTIPDSVTSIDSGAFCDCSSLTSVKIGNGVKNIGSGAFEDCSSLESVTIPDSVTSIGWSAFANCSNLTSAKIGNGVKSIDGWAFRSCIGMTSVTIPDSVTSIGESAFEGCSKINAVYYNGNLSSWLGIDFSYYDSNPCCSGANLYFNGELVTDVVIPDNITSIGNSAFYCCSSLTSVTIGNSVTSIDDSAFSGCSSLTSATIPDSVTRIEYASFHGCSSLTSVAIPSSVTSIGSGAFSDCSSLKKITIPKSVTAIAYGSFKGCSSLASVSVPTSVKKIEGRAFQACDSLNNVYYSGSSAQWKSIVIDKYHNGDLLNATIHYSGNVSTPAAPVIKITTSAGKPKISWSKVDGATKYYVYRSTDGKKYSLLVTTEKTSVTNSKAKIGTTYYYKVKAAKVVNGKTVKSMYSNVKSIKCVPAAPVVSISRSNGKPKLTWKAVTGASKYYIYRSTDGKTYKQYTYTTKTTYTNTGAASGKKYYYKVKAVAVVNKKNVFSAYSTAKNLMTTIATPTVSITTANGKPKITWKAVTGADKYIVYRSTDGKTFKQLSTTTKTGLTNTGAKKNTKYYYKVKAVCTKNTKANSALSKAVSIKATK